MMCLGAILISRISRLVIGTSNYKNFFCLNDNVNDFLKNNKIIVKKNVLQKKCTKILKNFFQQHRMD